MKQPEIENAILRNLYEAYFRSESGYNMKNIRESGGWDEIAFWIESDSLEHDGLIKAWAMGGYYRITSAGILYTRPLAKVKNLALWTSRL
jgi:hypothetical protein